MPIKIFASEDATQLYAMLLVNTTYHCNITEECKYQVNRLKELADEHPDVPDIVIVLAKGLFNLSNKQNKNRGEQLSHLPGPAAQGRSSACRALGYRPFCSLCGGTFLICASPETDSRVARYSLEVLDGATVLSDQDRNSCGAYPGSVSIPPACAG